MVKEKKFVCSLELFLNLFVGCVVKCLRSIIILWGPLLLLLPSAKLGTFSSLPRLGRLNGLYVNNIQSAAAIILCGNNFGKVSRLAEF